MWAVTIGADGIVVFLVETGLTNLIMTRAAAGERSFGAFVRVVAAPALEIRHGGVGGELRHCDIFRVVAFHAGFPVRLETAFFGDEVVAGQTVQVFHACRLDDLGLVAVHTRIDRSAKLVDGSRVAGHTADLLLLDVHLMADRARDLRPVRVVVEVTLAAGAVRNFWGVELRVVAHLGVENEAPQRVDGFFPCLAMTLLAGHVFVVAGGPQGVLRLFDVAVGAERGIIVHIVREGPVASGH